LIGAANTPAGLAQDVSFKARAGNEQLIVGGLGLGRDQRVRDPILTIH